MPWGLKRYQEAHCLHFVTFSCYQRAPLLGAAQARDVFEQGFAPAWTAEGGRPYASRRGNGMDFTSPDT